MVYLLLGWAAVTGVAVFVLYLRDPLAAGRHRSHVDNWVTGAKRRMQSMCGNLRERGLCPLGR